MCGIFGIINPTGKFITGVYSMLPDFVHAGTIRGIDGTGLVKVFRSGEATWIKAAVPGYDFHKVAGVNEFMTGVGDCPFIIGHHRAATKGTINNENTHPFQHKHIYLVHNGTVTRTKELANGHDVSVDSHMICNHIADKGLQETINELYGAYSLVFYDEEKMSLNFIRNEERPMNFLYTKEGIIIYCSETLMGQWLAARRGFTVTKTMGATIHTHYEFKQGESEPIETIVKPDRKWIAPVKAALTSAYSPEARASKHHLRDLFSLFAVGSLVHFSIEDFEEPKKKGKFVRIQGDHPEHKEIICNGNYSGDIEALWSTKYLMSGVVATKSMDMKKGKVNLQLRDIKLTNLPDPFFLQVKEELKQEQEKVVSIHHKQRNKPQLSTKCCQECGHIFTRSDSDSPYLTVRDGVHKVLCAVCFMNTASPHSLAQ